MAPPAKQQKTSNFASAGRVLGTGVVKAARKAAKKNIGDDEDDYIPEASSEVTSGSVKNVVLVGKKRKRSSDGNDGSDSEIEDSGAVKLKTKALKRPVRIPAPKVMHRDRTAQQETRSNDNEAEEELNENDAKLGTKEVAGSDGSGDLGDGALRGGRNRDAFVNKYGTGHRL